MLGIELETSADRDGHLAGVYVPARQRPTRTDLYYRRPRLHRGLLPYR